GLNILSPALWAHLLSIRLHGFAGFTAAVMLLSFWPLMLATARIVWITGRYPWEKVPVAPKVTWTPPPPEPDPFENMVIPDEIPAEMREPYIRMMRGSLARSAKSAFELATLSADKKTEDDISAIVHQPSSIDEFALPDSFDVPAFDSAPAFSDLDFNSPLAGESQSASDEVAPSDAVRGLVEQHLISRKFEIEYDGDIIVASRRTKKFVIATHDSPEFWTADGDTWFANGAQKPSPVATLTAAAEKHNASPILLLQSDNIMDVADRINEWSAHDIRVIRDITEIM
ncbi:MAG: hypothetical protein LBR41_03265, partial [Rickettsiales bacterium]|nr:hypothetical protein [Rickettsiales bacterium]